MSKATELRRYAALGAQRMYTDLLQEVAKIEKLFPELKAAPDKGRKPPSSTRSWNMSKAQRTAVSARMKKYWAARRKEEKKGKPTKAAKATE